jgi:phosphoserine phosphatase
MSHEFFWYLIPGIVFYLPLYVAAVLTWLGLKNRSILDMLLNKDYVAFLSLLVLPTGWLIYHSWRAFWQLYRGGYEKRAFLNRVREAVSIYDQENPPRTIVDFSTILGKKVGVRWFNRNEFEIVFDPFKNLSFMRFNSRKDRYSRSCGRRRFLHFVEPVSDLILFKDASYDYARSISSARYSIWVSFFSFIVGSLLAFAVHVTIWFPNDNPLGWRWALIISMAAILGTLVIMRMRMARTEHESRVQLITQINSADRVYKDAENTAMIEPEILSRVEAAIKSIGPLSGHPKLAAFDMDGTLIRHDMGDAVFAMLIRLGKLTLDHWATYQDYLSTSRPKAYEYAVTAMRGLSLEEVYRAVYEVFDPDSTGIDLPGNIRVPKPEVVPKMQVLVMWLHRHEFEVYVVTATNQWAAEVVAPDFFGIPSDRVIGVRTAIEEGRLTKRICRPAPIGDGKRDAWKAQFKERKPLLGAGDSKGDHALLNLVEAFGLVLWAGSHEDRPALNNVLQIDLNQLETTKPIGRSTAGGI